MDLMAQADQLKQQTLATLTERDQQLRHLTAMLEEVQNQRPQLSEEHYQRQVDKTNNQNQILIICRENESNCLHH